MKRFFAWIVMFVAVLSMITVPAFASNCAENTENIIDLGDGFYMVETISSYSLSRSGDIIYGNKSGNIYQGSTLIGVANLYGTFDISGSTAKATSSSISGSGYNGGSYTGGTSNCSRNTVSGTANFTYNGMIKVGRLSITCSPDGTLS